MAFGAIALTPHSFAQQVAERAHLAKVQYRSHFEPNPGADPKSGSRDGWESFPLSQEAGYDPTIQVETAAGRSAIVREAAPTQVGPLRLGFVRRVHLVAGPGAIFHARIRSPHLAGKTIVRVSVFRGEREEHHDVTIVGSEWQVVECPLKAAHAWLTAVAADITFEHAHPGRAERVLMTDVRVEAFAPRRLALVTPQAMWDATRELYYIQRSALLSESLESRVKVTANEHPRWSLLAPDGHQRIAGMGDEARYVFTSSDPVGIWMLRFESDHASTDALVLVRDAKRGLLFDRAPTIPADLLASIRERQQTLRKIVHSEAGMNVDRMDPNWLLAGLPSYFAIVLQPAELAMLDAMMFRATGDRTALDEARELLHNIASWPRWVHPWFPAHGYHSYYPVGIMTKFVTMSEEFLGDDLPAANRTAIDQASMEQAIKPIYEEYVLEDRLQFNTSNWIGNTVGGALLAALANGDRSAAGYALGLFVKDRDHLRAAYTLDGSYGEGVTYHRFDLEMTTLVAQAAKRRLGTSVDDLLTNADRYMRYAAYGTSGLMDFGDSHVDLTPSNVFAYMASQNNSPSLTEFYFKYLDTGTAQLLSRVLWESQIKPLDNSIAKPPKSEPSSAIFPQRGVAVLRETLQPQSSVAAIRAGINFNHNHADQGSLFYASGGTLWFGEAGYADYYKDPSYPTFNIQAIGHNTLLIDENPESQILPGNAVQGVAPSFTHALIGEGASLVQADLTAAYNGTVSRYTRSLFFQPGGRMIVIDDIAANSPHTFQQLWHTKEHVAEFDTTQNRMQLGSGANRVLLQAFGTQPIVSLQKQDPMPLESYEQAEHKLVQRPVRMEVSTQQAATATTIFTVIEPESGAQAVTATEIWSDDGQFASLKKGDTLLRMRHGKNATGAAMMAWSKDSVLMLSGTRCEDERSGESVVTNHEVDMAMRRWPTGEIELEIYASQATELHLLGIVIAGKDPARTANLSSLTVDAGRTVLMLQRAAKPNGK